MKVTRTVDGQVIYSVDSDDPHPIVPESDPMCSAPQCLCIDRYGRPDPFCTFYRRTHVQEIPKGVVIA